MRKIIKRIKRVDYKLMWEMIGEISAKTNKSKISVLFDMLSCYRKYGTGYSEYHEYEYYLLNDAERATYMTSKMANQIVMKFNQSEYRHFFYDKSEFNKKFKDFVGRNWIDIRDVSKEEAYEFLKQEETVMIKETQNLMGHGVEKVVFSELDDFDKFYEESLHNKQYLWEEFFTQHPEMAKLYPKSVNTLRMITFYDGEEVRILEKIIKMGNGGHLDNFAAGGMYTILSDEGKVLYPAFDSHANEFTHHPVSKEKILGFQVPLYDEVIAMVKEAGKVVPEIPYVGWDVAIGEDGPILIEGNYNSGVFQMKPSITKEKRGLLPHYRKYIDF